jgi:hypothetical protein
VSIGAQQQDGAGDVVTGAARSRRFAHSFGGVVSRFTVTIRYHGVDAEHSRYACVQDAQAVARQLAADGQRVRVAREVER